MGLTFRRRSNILLNSKLIVEGVPPYPSKVFSPDLKKDTRENRVNPTPKPSSTPIPTPTPSPTPRPTPDNLIDPIITENNEYIIVGDGYYLQY